MTAINLLFTVDVENDGVAIHNERNRLSWNAISTIPIIKDIFDSHKLRVSWFVRADNQLWEIYGTSAYLLIKHDSLWNDLKGSGDEIGWHPHLYQWSENTNSYVVDIDNERCVQKLTDTYSELHAKGFNYTSVRIGEAFHNNNMMKTISNLGLKIDSTAIPGRKRQDSARFFDWEITPNEPYHPSKEDYRVPSTQDYLPILEVPMTTIPIKASYDKESLRRYINLSYHHSLFKSGFDAYLDTIQKQEKEQAFITIILHPDEVNNERNEHPLYSFSITEINKNIEYIINTFDSYDLEYRSLKMQNVLRYFSPS